MFFICSIHPSLWKLSPSAPVRQLDSAETRLLRSEGLLVKYGEIQWLWYRWPIEIDGLAIDSMVDLSMAMLNNQMVKSNCC